MEARKLELQARNLELEARIAEREQVGLVCDGGPVVLLCA